MTLARLDNEVFFKKALTDEIVFKAFVHDILGIDVNPDKIETEKAFQPKLGSINFKYDIFAEDIEKHVVIEIQKVEYDHNFDRFLHYHLQAITEQQRTSDDYSVKKIVNTIVVITSPYKVSEKTGKVMKDEILISTSNPKNFKNIERKIYNHELVFLNPNYKDLETPINYRDWLDLIYESIHHLDNPKINLNNAGVKRASEIANFDVIDPYEWEASKFAAASRKTLIVEREQEKIEIAIKAIENGLDNKIISTITDLSEEFIEILRNRKD